MLRTLPRVSGETTEVGWITSKRYIPYEVASFIISIVTCWLFWFLIYAVTTRMIGAPLWGYSPEDAEFLTTGLGVYLASMVTPFFAILWFLDEIEKATADREKVREFFGQRSWREIVRLARRLKRSP